MRLVPRLRFGALALAMIGLTAAGGLLAAQSATAGARRPQVLRVRWHLFADEGPVGLFGTGRFVLASFGNGAGHDVVIDDETGRRARLPVPRGCLLSPIAMNGPWLLFACGHGTPGNPPPMKVYRVSRPRVWRSVIPSPQLVQECNSPSAGGCLASGIGSHWVEYTVRSCEPGGTHCSSGSYEFQNIDTGQLANDPSSVGGTVIPDPNSPTRARKLCSPLQVPSEGQSPYDPGPVPGTVTPYGRFAVSSLAFVGDPGAGAASLHRCGSRLNQPLSNVSQGYGPPVGNPHVIVWAPGMQPDGQFPRRLGAVVLPSLRRLVIPVPAAIGASPGLVLGPHHLYMVGAETTDLYTIPTQALTRPSARS